MSEARDWNAEVIAEFRANKGEVKAPYDNPPPMLLLHTIGAKSGKEHIVPMRAMPDGESLYVFASAHGSEQAPRLVLQHRRQSGHHDREGHRDHPRPRDRGGWSRAGRHLRSARCQIPDLRGVSAKAQSNHPGNPPRSQDHLTATYVFLSRFVQTSIKRYRLTTPRSASPGAA